HPLGRVAAPRRARWGEVRRIRLDQESIDGNEARDVGGRLLAVPEDKAAERDSTSAFERLGTERHGTRIGVQDRRGTVATADSGRVELMQQRLMRVPLPPSGPAMEDQGFAQPTREHEVTSQVGELDRRWREEP